MGFSASGIGFSVNFSFNDDSASRAQTNNAQPQALPKPKYHDVYYVTEKKDYSFGTSPNALRSFSENGRGSPNKSPKL